MVVNQARNNQELENMLMPALEKAIDYVVQKIWNDNRELIRQIVYEAYQPKTYTRTGEFQNAWDTETKRSDNKVSGTFKYSPDKMSVDVGVHSSVYGGDDYREYLAETIYQGLAGDFGYGENTGNKRHAKTNPLFSGEAWAKKRDVWTALNKKIGIRKIQQYFEEGMRRNGLNFNRHVAAIKVTKYDEK